MFNWSLRAHPTSSYPFKFPPMYKSIHFLHPFTPIQPPLFYYPCLNLCYPNMDTKYSEEAYDIFYLEIEERIMLVISDDEDEAPTGRNRAPPLLNVNGAKPHFFPNSNSFLDVNCYGSFDLRMRQRQTCFGRRNWETSSKARGRRAPVTKQRKGTGVFIPRSA